MQSFAPDSSSDELRILSPHPSSALIKPPATSSPIFFLSSLPVSLTSSPSLFLTPSLYNAVCNLCASLNTCEPFSYFSFFLSFILSLSPFLPLFLAVLAGMEGGPVLLCSVYSKWRPGDHTAGHGGSSDGSYAEPRSQAT